MNEYSVGDEIYVRIVDDEGDYQIEILHEVRNPDGNIVGYGTTPHDAETIAGGLNRVI